MTKQFLTEFISPAQRPLTSEHDTDGKNLWLKGIALQAEIENHNGRRYPLQEIRNACESLATRIKEFGGVLGQADHPPDLMISTKDVSHVIKEVWIDGNNGCAKMQIINEGCGKIIRGIIEAGGIVGVSTRGSGSVDSKGIVSEFDIITIDIVATPSAPAAYPKPMYESLINSHTGRELKKLSELQDDKAAQRYFQQALHKYLMEIRDDVVWKKR